MYNNKKTIEVVTIDKYTFTIYERENRGRFPNHGFAVLYEKATPKGKYAKSKTIEHFVQKSYEDCEKYVTDLYKAIYDRVKRNEQEKAEKREAQKNLKAIDHYQVGSIIYDSWGYEQTNIDFYQVKKVTAKSIVVQRIGSSQVEDSMYSHGMACEVVAVPDSFLEGHEEIVLRVNHRGGLNSKHGSFSKWDGTPKYKSWYY